MQKNQKIKAVKKSAKNGTGSLNPPNSPEKCVINYRACWAQTAAAFPCQGTDGFLHHFLNAIFSKAGPTIKLPNEH